jgi:peptidoglycan/LPS O-acetylase OafA/YrhL
MDESLSTKQRISIVLQSIHSWFAHKLDDQKPKGAIASLDGVRALAFLTVFIFHLCIMTSQLHLWHPQRQPLINALTSAGGSGVTLFFILSGFLLFLPYSQAILLQKNWPEAKIFYLRRVLRIIPLYYFSLFIFIVFRNDYLLKPHNLINIVPFLTLTMNFSQSQPIDGPYWTLAVEFQYYLLLPLIALGIYGLSRLVRPEQRLWVVVASLLAMVVWGLATRRWGEYLSSHPHETFLVSRSTLDHIFAVIYGQNGKFFEDFAMGMLIATFYVYVTNKPEKARYFFMMQRLSLGFGIAWLVLYILASMRNLSIMGGYMWPVASHLFQIFPWANEFGFAISYSCCMLAVLFNRPGGLLRRLFEWTPLRWLGLISFGLYLWHEPFIQIIQNNLGPDLSHIDRHIAIILCVGLAFSVAVSFSFATYVMIEKPGFQLSSRLRQQLLQRRAKRQEPTSTGNLISHEKPIEKANSSLC